jgi:hypothetical protein
MPKNCIIGIFTLVFMVSIFAIGIAYANDAVPITAEQAFNAYANQEDPISGDPANVAIVDDRTTAEYYWVGTCAQVDRIITTKKILNVTIRYYCDLSSSKLFAL